MSRKIATLISDIHFNLNNLPVATAALRLALQSALGSNIPLVICGDLNDTKAIIRAEVANTIIGLFKEFNSSVDIYVIAGNHDHVHERSPEHGLNYLKPYVRQVIDSTGAVHEIGSNVVCMPYQSSLAALRQNISYIKPGSIVLMHQGVRGAYMGDYVVDNSSIEVEALSHLRCFSGHYHRHQTLGTLTYIGSPYTISASEANDGPKGILEIYADGTFNQIALGLRRHVVVERTFENLLAPVEHLASADLLQLKVSGTRSQLHSIDKQAIAEALGLVHQNFRLDLKPVDEVTEVKMSRSDNVEDILDSLVDQLTETSEKKHELKGLWRELSGCA